MAAVGEEAEATEAGVETESADVEAVEEATEAEANAEALKSVSVLVVKSSDSNSFGSLEEDACLDRLVVFERLTVATGAS